MSSFYTTVGVVQRKLRISAQTDVDLLTELIEDVSELFDAECNRQFFRQAAHVELVAGFGGLRLTVRDHLPIVSVTQIRRLSDTPNGTPEIVDAATYAVEDACAGFIRKSSAWDWTTPRSASPTQDPIAGAEEKLYEVTYDGGYITRNQSETVQAFSGLRDLPRDIERAIIDQVVTDYQQLGRDKTVTSKRLMSGAISYGGSGAGVSSDQTASFRNAVQRYGLS